LEILLSHLDQVLQSEHFHRPGCLLSPENTAPKYIMGSVVSSRVLFFVVEGLNL